jgi:site-specific recombinase XerD
VTPEDLRMPEPWEVAVIEKPRSRSQAVLASVPAIIAGAGERAAWRFLEFFTANIRNKNTRRAYARAVRGFCDWLAEHEIYDLAHVNPVLVAAYVDHLGKDLSKPSVKQHLAAIRMLCDYLVTGGVLPFNPASSVRGPKYVIKRGKTPVLDDDQMDELLAAIDLSTLHGLRDRALIAVMAFDFARIGAVVAMDVGDYFQQGKKWWFRLHEKGGKHHELPAHHKAEEFMDAYLEALRAAGAPHGKDTPLFRTGKGRSGELGETRMTENDALRMVKRRAKGAGLPSSTCNHSFRATCITNFRKNGGSRGKAAQLAAHESERTTRLYDRSDDPVTLDEIERVNYRSDT